MNTMTSAERQEFLVEFGARHYRETFLRLFAQEMKGGRVPGVAESDPDDVLAYFQQTPPDYWRTLAFKNPLAYKQQVTAYRRAGGT